MPQQRKKEESKNLRGERYFAASSFAHQIIFDGIRAV